jgi:GT2 family glycosyltransferase
VPALVAELGDGDELLVVDNDPSRPVRSLVSQHAPDARMIEPGKNIGFAAAANRGAEAASGDLLVILNPDAMPLPGWGDAIRLPLADQRRWDAWMPLVACEGGALVNTIGNPVHFAGFAWAGGHGRPLTEGVEAGEVPAASGACLVVPAERWRELGGFPPEFFLYHEDIDFSMRLWLFGGTVGIEPRAMVDHDYEFDGRPQKWRWLERNRLAFVIRVYPGPLLVLLLPALLATELILLPVAAAGGWLPQKLGSWWDLVRWLPRLIRERRAIQDRRSLPAVGFAALLTAELDSPYFGGVGQSRIVRLALSAYWRVVLALLRR